MITLRIVVLVVVLGGWELSARLKWIDPFFFSMPIAIFDQIVDWFVNGTSQGPLLTQVWVTLEETGLGFIIGSVAGVFCGIVLGRNKLLSDVFSLYIKIANSIPRVVLGSVFVIALGLGHGVEGGAGGGDGVLRRVRAMRSRACAKRTAT